MAIDPNEAFEVLVPGQLVKSMIDIDELLDELVRKSNIRSINGNSFSDNIRVLRLERGMSQKQVAKMIGIDKFLYAMMENDEGMADMYSQLKLYELFESSQKIVTKQLKI